MSSNVNSSSKIWGAAALVGGTAIGAGILGLPVIAGMAGFYPAVIAMFLMWGLMLITGLIILNLMCKTCDTTPELPSLFEDHLGWPGKWVLIFGYLLLFYGLLTAYLAGSGAVLKQLIPLSLSTDGWSIIFFAVMSGMVMFGLDLVRRGNAFFMTGLILSFVLLTVATGMHMKPARLTYQDWTFWPSILPIILCSFGFHIIIPVVGQSLQWNRKDVRKALLLGAVLILLINIIWLVYVLGAIPLDDSSANSLLMSYEKNLPATIPLIRKYHSRVIDVAGSVFFFLAMITSYLAIGVGLLGFIRDLTPGLNHRKGAEWFRAIMVFLPPLAAVLLVRGLFLKALNLVGGVGVILIFAILPLLIYTRLKRNGLLRWIAIVLLFLCVLLLGFEILQEAGFMKTDPKIEHWTSIIAKPEIT